MALKLTSGYRLDFAQIARIAWFCNQPGNTEITGTAIAERLGISSARLHRLWMIANALGIGEKGTWRTTRLGNLILQYDKFLDDVGTLWLLHYYISSDPDVVVWNVMVNRVCAENGLVTMPVAKKYFVGILDQFSRASFEEHLNKEINSFFDAYTGQHFAALDYLQEKSLKTYGLGKRGAPPVRIFEAALLLFRERFAPNVVTMNIPSLANAINSPGRVFALAERQVRDLLEEIEGSADIYVESRADLDQIRFRDTRSFLDALHCYYEER